jgi:hypothetical protein
MSVAAECTANVKRFIPKTCRQSSFGKVRRRNSGGIKRVGINRGVAGAEHDGIELYDVTVQYYGQK